MTTFDLPTASEWLDMLREAKGYTTDAECAEYLGTSKQAVSHWRKNMHQLGTLDCLNLAEAIGVNPLFVIICSAFNSSPNPDKRTQLIQHAVGVHPKVPPDRQPEPGDAE